MAKAVFECRVTQIVALQDAGGGATDTHMVFGEVVGVHIHTTLLVDGIYQTAKADPVLRAGGPGTYFRIDEHNKFDMRRPG